MEKRIESIYHKIMEKQYYLNAKKDWNRIKKFILEDKDRGYNCKKCDTNWEYDFFINDSFIEIDGKEKNFICCPNCDKFYMPYLSNPINRENVIKYVDKKYHKFIF